MSDAVSIALSAAALAQASSAASNAERAVRLAECASTMHGYKDEGATLAQSRAYASCVYDVRGSGEPLTAGEQLGIKIVIIFLLLTMSIGAYRGWKEDRLEGACVFAFVGLAFGLAALVVFFAIDFVIF